MRRARVMRAAAWVSGLVMLAWLMGLVPVTPAPLDYAYAGFFGNVKDSKSTDKPAPKAPPPSSSQGSGAAGKGSGGFFKDVSEKKSPAPSSPPQSSPPPKASPPQSSPPPQSPASGGFFKPATKPPQAQTPSPPQTAPAPGLSPPPGVGFVTVPRERPTPTVVVSPQRERPATAVPIPSRGWQRPEGVLDAIKTAPELGWTSRGYFDQLRRERITRRSSDAFIYWYYPYDYAYYCWRRYHYAPWYIWPYYYYPTYYYYYPTPPVIILAEPADWTYGESYVPYATWPSERLMEARRNLERAWREERIDLLARHLDPERDIASYFRDEYTHSLSAEEFRQLTLDAFEAIRTISFEFTSVRYVSTGYWARLKGKHVFYDPYGEQTVVYVSYLMRRIDRDGRAWWVIWEVRQSPYPE